MLIHCDLKRARTDACDLPTRTSVQIKILFYTDKIMFFHCHCYTCFYFAISRKMYQRISKVFLLWRENKRFLRGWKCRWLCPLVVSGRWALPPVASPIILVNKHESLVAVRPWMVVDSRCGFSSVVCLGDPAAQQGLKPFSLCCPRGHDGWSPQGATSAAAACPRLLCSSKTNCAPLSLFFILIARCDGCAGKCSPAAAAVSSVQIGLEWILDILDVKVCHLEPLFPLWRLYNAISCIVLCTCSYGFVVYW